MTQGQIDTEWSRSVAHMAVGGLMAAKLITSADQERAVAIVAEEILVRLCLDDRPNADNWRYQSKPATH